MNRTAVVYALASAALFGLSTPAAKLLLGSIDPMMLAGLLYCGAGTGIALLRRLGAGSFTRAEAAESRSDVRIFHGLQVRSSAVVSPGPCS